MTSSTKVCRTLIILFFTFSAVCAFAVIIYLQFPLFGAVPEGQEMSRIAQSPNQTGGTFHNEIATPLLTTNESEIAMWWSNFTQSGKTRPPHEIPSIKTNLKTLNIRDDLVIWLGHSSYYVQLNGMRLLVDPVFSINASPVINTNVAFDGTSLYTEDDIPEIDFLLISHDHYDHLDYPTIKSLQTKVKHVVTGLGVGSHFERWGYDKKLLREMDWYQTLSIRDTELQIHITPARHFSGRRFTRDRTQWVGFALTTPQHKIFFSGDSGYAPHFTEIGRRYGPFNWVTLDMGQYDTKWANVHMTPEQAAQAAEDLHAQVLSPGHVGRFSLAPHDWDDPFKRIVRASQQRTYTLWTPEIGQTIFLDERPQQFTSWWEDVTSH